MPWAGRWTEYFYDADRGNRDINHQTNNNRLLWYDEYDPEYESGEKPVRTVKYTYYKNGRASNITIFDAGDLDGEDRHLARDLALYYAASGSLWLAVRGTWSVDEEGDVVENSYATIDGREFRYDTLRGRYLSRAVNTNSSADPTEWTFGDALWTDYDGDEPYLDFTASIEGKSIATVPTMRYTGAGGTFAQQSLDALGDPVSTRYYHADLVGSTTALTDEAGEIPTGGGAGPVRLTYTAFGEAVVYDTGESEWKVTTTQPSGSPRYQYAGAHGYEADLLVLEGKPGSRPITLKHVGARWYQPDIGRFVQRDPIGIAGGLNVYGYAESTPPVAVDPDGLTCIELTVHAYLGIGQRGISDPAVIGARESARRVVLQMDRWQQLQWIIMGNNGVTVVYQVTGRYAYCIRTVWWTE
ncbi:MAG: RHS repeat-associated core domain-containing protein [Phycisphaerae bacterium]